MDSYRIVYHPEGDWEGLYKNGKLLDEGHSGTYETLLNILIREGVLDYKDYWCNLPKDEEGYWPANMPENLPEEDK